MVSDQQLQELRRRDAHHATGKVAKKVPPFSPKGTPSFRTPSFQPKGDTQFSGPKAQRGHPVFSPKGCFSAASAIPALADDVDTAGSSPSRLPSAMFSKLPVFTRSWCHLIPKFGSPFWLRFPQCGCPLLAFAQIPAMWVSLLGLIPFGVLLGFLMWVSLLGFFPFGLLLGFWGSFGVFPLGWSGNEDAVCGD